jgi:hypothetical protein
MLLVLVMATCLSAVRCGGGVAGECSGRRAVVHPKEAASAPDAADHELSAGITLDVSPSRNRVPQPTALELFSLSLALFVENRGQWRDPAVRYMHDGSFADVAMTDSEIVFHITCQAPESRGPINTRPGLQPERRPRRLMAKDAGRLVRRFSASFIGAKAVRPTGLKCSQSIFNYHVGDRANWRDNVASYQIVAYRDLYEGIDLHVRGLRSHLKYEFHVAPGADYRQIAVRYVGIEGLSIAEDGSLEVDLGSDWGVIRDDTPHIYQEIDGRKVEVAGRFALLDDHSYSFELSGTIDPEHALVIDPDLAWSTYLSGGNDDVEYGSGIAVDASGDVYVTGPTWSVGWASGGFDTTLDGGIDAFVVKLSSGGAHLWSTYLGGGMGEHGYGIAVDASGGVYVTGTTSSFGWASGGYDTTHNGGWWDTFLVKLSSSGAHLWSTYLGGSGEDSGHGVAVDASGSVYVTGHTKSSGWTSGGFDTTYNGSGDYGDAFVAKLSSEGAHLWSTYLGGDQREDGLGIAVDTSGNAYVTGTTWSPGWTSGGFNTTFNGGDDTDGANARDGFVAKLSPTGGHVWSTYLGGSDWDNSNGIAVDASGGIYVTGETKSRGWTSGGFDTSFNGDIDAFVAKLNSDGAHVWSTYLGGGYDDRAYGVAVDVGGGVCVTGYTQSPGWVSGGFDTTYVDWMEAFVAKLSSGGGHLWSSYLGGSDYDEGYAIAVDASHSIYVTGYTDSSGWTSGGFDTTYNGANDPFVAKIEETATRHDWNGDGIVSIVGDVPPFVQCVYFGSCPGGVDPVTVGDCNHDGIISIVGDVPCFVNCVYFGNCGE